MDLKQILKGDFNDYIDLLKAKSRESYRYSEKKLKVLLETDEKKANLLFFQGINETFFEEIK